MTFKEYYYLTEEERERGGMGLGGLALGAAALGGLGYAAHTGMLPGGWGTGWATRGAGAAAPALPVQGPGGIHTPFQGSHGLAYSAKPAPNIVGPGGGVHTPMIGSGGLAYSRQPVTPPAGAGRPLTTPAIAPVTPTHTGVGPGGFGPPGSATAQPQQPRLGKNLGAGPEWKLPRDGNFTTRPGEVVPPADKVAIDKIKQIDRSQYPRP